MGDQSADVTMEGANLCVYSIVWRTTPEEAAFEADLQSQGGHGLPQVLPVPDQVQVRNLSRAQSDPLPDGLDRVREMGLEVDGQHGRDAVGVVRVGRLAPVPAELDAERLGALVGQRVR